MSEIKVPAQPRMPTLSEGSQEDSFLAASSLWWLLTVLGVPWLWQYSFSVCLCLHMAFFLCVFSVKDTSQWVRVHPNPVWPHPNELCLQRPCFSKRTTFWVQVDMSFEQHYSSQCDILAEYNLKVGVFLIIQAFKFYFLKNSKNYFNLTILTGNIYKTFYIVLLSILRDTLKYYPRNWK